MTPLSVRPIWWKVIIGAILLLSELGNVLNRRRLPGTPASDQQQGMEAMQIVLLLTGVWLIYSGTAPLRRKRSV